jgi:hypothetical protein
MAYIFIKRNVYHQNKKQIDDFINQDGHIAKLNFNKNSDIRFVVEIHVQFLSDFEKFVEYMFRTLGKDVFAYVGIRIGFFQELEEMKVMIPEIHKKMWIVSDRQGSCALVCAKVSDYKLIGLLDKYDKYFRYGYDKNHKIDEMFKDSMEEKINEYRGIEENNNK